MEAPRLICEKEVPLEIQKLESFTESFSKSLDSVKATVEQTLQHHEEVGKLKCSLRAAEDEYVKVLAVKTRNEAKQMAIREAISAARARNEELKRTVQLQRARRDEYELIMSRHSLEKRNKVVEHDEEVEEAILWYNRVLHFQIEGGRGVKFLFRNISERNPYEEFYFTIRHEDDKYTLLACDPQLSDTKELIHELNKTNGLFKFVRMMRKKFQETGSLVSGQHANVEISPQSSSLHQESAMISVSAPVLSVSTETSESPVLKDEHSQKTVKKPSKRVNHAKGVNQTPLSVRRSPRHLPRK